jgi:hypothetical protein
MHFTLAKFHRFLVTLGTLPHGFRVRPASSAGRLIDVNVTGGYRCHNDLISVL